MPPATTPRTPARRIANRSDIASREVDTLDGVDGAVTDSVTDSATDSGGVPQPSAVRVGLLLARARRERNLTLAAVAERCGLSPAYVSQIESATANPTLRALEQLAAAVGTDLASALRGDRGKTDRLHDEQFAYHARAARALDVPGANGVWDRSAPGGRLLHNRIVHAEPADHGKPVRHEGEEYLLVLQGSCRLHVAGDVRVLRPGDSCHFAAQQLHHLSAISADLTLSVVMSGRSS